MKGISKLSRSERMWAVYAAYGKAMMSAHSLEGKLAALLIARESGESYTKTQFQTKREKIDKLTLGTLVERFLMEFEPTNEVTHALKTIVPIRNELVHRISKYILHATLITHWEEGVVSELLKITDSFLEVISKLQPFTDYWLSEIRIEYEELFQAELAKHPGISAQIAVKTHTTVIPAKAGIHGGVCGFPPSRE